MQNVNKLNILKNIFSFLNTQVLDLKCWNAFKGYNVVGGIGVQNGTCIDTLEEILKPTQRCQKHWFFLYEHFFKTHFLKNHHFNHSKTPFKRPYFSNPPCTLSDRMVSIPPSVALESPDKLENEK